MAACLVPAAASAQLAKCQVPPDPAWSVTEASVWSKLCTGYVADLSAQDTAPQPMQGPAAWPADRTLSAAFLVEILTDPRYALGQTGAGPIIISGARFTDPVRIVDADLKNELILDSSRFDGGLDIEDSTSTKGLFLRHDAFGGPINIQRSSFQLLWLRRGSAPAINIADDAFDDDVLIESATLPGGLAIAATKIGAGGLTLRSASGIDNRIGPMKIVGSTIDGSTEISNAYFAGEFDGGRTTFGNGLDIGNSSFAALAFFQDTDFVRSVSVSFSSFNNDLRFDTSKFESAFVLDQDQFCLRNPGCELFLADANFGGKVSIRDTLINGDLNADGASAASSFELLNDGSARYPLKVTMINANFARNLVISQTTLASMILANAGIAGTLQFDAPSIYGNAGLLLPDLPSVFWAKDSSLNLQGANIGVLRNTYWTWPRTLFLDGMHFGLIGLKFPDLDTGCIGGAWSDWLAGMPRYSPQPYQQLAKYLTDSGQAGAAACVMRTGETRSLGQLRLVPRVIKWTYGQVAGYGYAPALAFIYVILFVLIGMLVLRLTGEGKKNGMPIGMFYSLSQLVPLVTLDKRFDDIELTGAARYYFFLHKIVGWVIVGFLTAALTSLSSKG
jgi:uncharacterized membrane protein YhaH (DUF805 family)